MFSSRQGCFCVVLLALSWAATGPARAADGNPGYDRPGIGFAPSVLAAGDVTWEQGLPDFVHDREVTLYSADGLLRVGLGGPLELQLGSSWNHVSAPWDDVSGRGDSSVGLKLALPARGAFSWGLLGSVTLHDGASAFTGGRNQYLLATALGWQLDARNGLGAYLEATHTDGATSRLLAVNAGHAFNDAVGGYVEWAWQDAAHVGTGTMAGAGVTWQVTPRVQLDASFRHRLGGTIDTWQGGLGVAVFFGGL